jgi:hypothetical protein
MMHGREKSDSAIVAEKPTNKAVRPQRSRWSQGQGPRGTRTSKAWTGHRTGIPCHRRWSAYGESQKAVRRHAPKVGAVCGNSARTDLSGGRSAMTVPTALKRRETGKE